MAKDIKFRAYHKGRKIMYEVGSINFRKKWIGINYFNEEQNEFELMCYIGLKDKNRKEIYEGDMEINL